MLNWLRGVRTAIGSAVGAGRVHPSVRTPRSRVLLPSVMAVPGDVLRTLRQFHPDLDAYAFPDRVWLLKYEENKGRILEGRKALFMAKLEGDYGDLESAHLMAEGWSLMGELPLHEGMSAGAMLRHAQMTLYATPKQIEEDHTRRRRIADGTEQRRLAIERVRERLYGDTRFDHSYAYRGRRTVSTTGARFNPFPARSLRSHNS